MVESKKYNDKIVLLRLVLGDEVVTLVTAYAPQAGLRDDEKTGFQDCLDVVVRAIPQDEIICIWVTLMDI